RIIWRPPSDQPVGQRDRPRRRNLERRLVGADGIDLVRDDPALQLLPEVERLDPLLGAELVHARTTGADRYPERFDQAIAVTVVMTVRQKDRARRTVFAEPFDRISASFEALCRQQRVDQYPAI